jgi:hypothetical protein
MEEKKTKSDYWIGTIRAICMQAIGAVGFVLTAVTGVVGLELFGRWGGVTGCVFNFFFPYKTKEREELLLPADTSLPHRRDETDYMRGT